MHIAVIPARAGSKAIRNKNLMPVGGKGLAHRSIQHAKDAGFFDRIILSTDIPTLCEEWETSKSPEIFPRPTELAGDGTLMIDVLTDLIKKANAPGSAWIWLLQPTSPFRQREHFNAVKALLKQPKAGSVISVKSVGGEHDNRSYTIVQGALKRLHFTSFKNRQELPEQYRRSGAFYVARAEMISRSRSLEVPDCLPYLMNWPYCLNIDSPKDLIEAQFIESVGLARYLKQIRDLDGTNEH